VDDWLNVWCRVAEMGTSSFTMEFIITRDGDDSPVVKARNVMVSYNFTKNEVQPVPDFLRKAIEKFEAGE
jgi:acyl-CoA thioester hydrolase